MEYRDKLVLAPMVRVGTLPFRMLAAEYGADITYGEEIIDHKFLKCERVINESLGTTDFLEKGTDNVVFRTCPQERGRVVFQMGTSNAVRALKAAEIMCNDVAAIDINMGCPKSFSLSGGMGAALLSKPELIHDILTTLRRNLDTTVTCKIHLLNEPKDTVELARRIEKTGVPALAVHGRKVKDRPRDPAKWDEIADVVSVLSIPVIANGDIFEYEDFKRLKDSTGAASVMVARGAMWNASIFCSKGKTPWEDVKKEYVRKSILWDNDIKSTKHTLKEMIMHHSCLELPEGKAVIKCDTSADVARLYGEEDYYNFVNSNTPACIPVTAILICFGGIHPATKECKLCSFGRALGYLIDSARIHILLIVWDSHMLRSFCCIDDRLLKLRKHHSFLKLPQIIMLLPSTERLGHVLSVEIVYFFGNSN